METVYTTSKQKKKLGKNDTDTIYLTVIVYTHVHNNNTEHNSDSVLLNREKY